MSPLGVELLVAEQQDPGALGNGDKSCSPGLGKERVPVMLTGNRQSSYIAFSKEESQKKARKSQFPVHHTHSVRILLPLPKLLEVNQ